MHPVLFKELFGNEQAHWMNPNKSTITSILTTHVLMGSRPLVARCALDGVTF